MNDQVNDEAKDAPSDAGWMMPGLLGPYGHQPDAAPQPVIKPDTAPPEPRERAEHDSP